MDYLSALVVFVAGFFVGVVTVGKHLARTQPTAPKVPKKPIKTKKYPMKFEKTPIKKPKVIKKKHK